MQDFKNSRCSHLCAAEGGRRLLRKSKPRIFTWTYPPGSFLEAMGWVKTDVPGAFADKSAQQAIRQLQDTADTQKAEIAELRKRQLQNTVDAQKAELEELRKQVIDKGA